MNNLLNKRNLTSTEFKLLLKTISDVRIRFETKSNYKWNRSTKLYDKLNLIKTMKTKSDSKENAPAAKKTVPALAKVKTPTTAKEIAKATKKLSPKGKASKKVGVIASIYEFLGKRPQTAAQIVVRLLKRFPKKSEKSMLGTIACQIGSEKGRDQHPAKKGYAVQCTVKGKGKDKVKSFTGNKL